MDARPNAGMPTALELEPEEYLSGWDPQTARLFLPVLASARLNARVAIRITIRRTGIGATVSGPVVAVRHAPGPGLPAGGQLALAGRSAGPANYLAQVARGLPVDFNERDPRFAVAWGLTLGGAAGNVQAQTVNVSEEGCAVSWRGAPVRPGTRVLVRRGRLLATTLPAVVCWSTAAEGLASAGLHLEPGPRAGQAWRAALDREVRRGAQRV
jgi:hypothetical protein